MSKIHHWELWPFFPAKGNAVMAFVGNVSPGDEVEFQGERYKLIRHIETIYAYYESSLDEYDIEVWEGEILEIP